MDLMRSSILLETDYEDYYDHLFLKADDPHAPADAIRYVRNKKDEIPRKHLFSVLHSHRLLTPPHGIVKDLRLSMDMKQAVVVFTEPSKHSGGQKHVMGYQEALMKHSKEFMTVFSNSEPNVTYRYLVIGERAFYLECKVKDHWDFNVNPKINIEEVEPGNELKGCEPFPVPIYSIDFTSFKDKNGQEWMVAVDLNLAPTLKGTGIDELLYPFEIQTLIENWFKKNPDVAPIEIPQQAKTLFPKANKSKKKKKKR